MGPEWIGLAVLAVAVFAAVWAAWWVDRRQADQHEQEAIRRFWQKLAQQGSGRGPEVESDQRAQDALRPAPSANGHKKPNSKLGN
jgi:hypothetical protein